MKRNLLTVIILISLLYRAQAQADVTGVYSDFGGFWQSSTDAVSSTKPNNSHGLLAITVGSTTYSTGVDDSKLTANGVTFDAQEFKALPVVSVSSTGGFIGVGKNYGGDGDVSPVPVTNDAASYLTDGVNGLDLGTGVYNLPGDTENIYTVSSISAGAIGDGIPDIIVTQIGDPGSSDDFDIFRFVDAGGNTVGDEVTVDVSEMLVVGKIDMKFYNRGDPPTYASGPSSNPERDLRLLTYDFADFGLTAANIGNITGLGQEFSGDSDQSFIAYNANSLQVYQSISGTVYEDSDGGTPDGTGYEDVTVELLDEDDSVIATTTSDADGNYSFSNVAPGDYTIRMTTPSGYHITGSSDGGTDNEISVTMDDDPIAGQDFGIDADPTAVSLLNFNVYKKDNTVLLVWATATEHNNKGFDIEKSTDSKTWTYIGSVNSKATDGNSSLKLDYSFTDNNPLNGQNFYRLKQTDFDGKYTYSYVRTVILDRTDYKIIVYPNPATHSISISGITGSEAVQVYNASGQLMQSEKTESSMHVLEIGHLDPGVYMLIIYDAGTILSTHKIVKD